MAVETEDLGVYVPPTSIQFDPSGQAYAYSPPPPDYVAPPPAAPVYSNDPFSDNYNGPPSSMPGATEAEQFNIAQQNRAQQLWSIGQGPRPDAIAGYNSGDSGPYEDLGPYTPPSGPPPGAPQPQDGLGPWDSRPWTDPNGNQWRTLGAESRRWSDGSDGAMPVVPYKQGDTELRDAIVPHINAIAQGIGNIYGQMSDAEMLAPQQAIELATGIRDAIRGRYQSSIDVATDIARDLTVPMFSGSAEPLPFDEADVRKRIAQRGQFTPEETDLIVKRARTAYETATKLAQEQSAFQMAHMRNAEQHSDAQSAGLLGSLAIGLSNLAGDPLFADEVTPYADTLNARLDPTNPQAMLPGQQRDILASLMGKMNMEQQRSKLRQGLQAERRLQAAQYPNSEIADEILNKPINDNDLARFAMRQRDAQQSFVKEQAASIWNNNILTRWAPTRVLGIGIAKGVSSLTALGSRGVGGLQNFFGGNGDAANAWADSLHDFNNSVEAGTAELDKKSIIPAPLLRFGRGAVQAYTEMAITGKLSEASGLDAMFGIGSAAEAANAFRQQIPIITQAALSTAENAYVEGRQAGLSGNQLGTYVTIQGALSGAVMSLFGAFGHGGAQKILSEGMYGKQGAAELAAKAASGTLNAAETLQAKAFLAKASQGIQGAVREAGKDAIDQLTQQEIIAIGGAVTDQAMGVRPDAMHADQIAQTLYEAAGNALTMAIGGSVVKHVFSRPDVTAKAWDALIHGSTDPKYLKRITLADGKTTLNDLTAPQYDAALAGLKAGIMQADPPPVVAPQFPDQALEHHAANAAAVKNVALTEQLAAQPKSLATETTDTKAAREEFTRSAMNDPYFAFHWMQQRLAQLGGAEELQRLTDRTNRKNASDFAAVKGLPDTKGIPGGKEARNALVNNVRELVTLPEGVKEFVNQESTGEVKQPLPVHPDNRLPLTTYWQRVNEEAPLPNHPAVETVDSPIGKFAKLKEIPGVTIPESKPPEPARVETPPAAETPQGAVPQAAPPPEVVPEKLTPEQVAALPEVELQPEPRGGSLTKKSPQPTIVKGEEAKPPTTAEKVNAFLDQGNEEHAGVIIRDRVNAKLGGDFQIVAPETDREKQLDAWLRSKGATPYWLDGKSDVTFGAFHARDTRAIALNRQDIAGRNDADAMGVVAHELAHDIGIDSIKGLVDEATWQKARQDYYDQSHPKIKENLEKSPELWDREGTTFAIQKLIEGSQPLREALFKKDPGTLGKIVAKVKEWLRVGPQLPEQERRVLQAFADAEAKQSVGKARSLLSGKKTGMAKGNAAPKLDPESRPASVPETELARGRMEAHNAQAGPEEQVANDADAHRSVAELYQDAKRDNYPAQFELDQALTNPKNHKKDGTPDERKVGKLREAVLSDDDLWQRAINTYRELGNERDASDNAESQKSARTADDEAPGSDVGSKASSLSKRAKAGTNGKSDQRTPDTLADIEGGKFPESVVNARTAAADGAIAGGSPDALVEELRGTLRERGRGVEPTQNQLRIELAKLRGTEGNYLAPVSKDSSDLDLIAHIVNGGDSKAAQDALVAKYGKAMMQAAKDAGIREADTHDVMMDRLYGHSDERNADAGKGKFRGWFEDPTQMTKLLDADNKGDVKNWLKTGVNQYAASELIRLSGLKNLALESKGLGGYTKNEDGKRVFSAISPESKAAEVFGAFPGRQPPPPKHPFLERAHNIVADNEQIQKAIQADPTSATATLATHNVMRMLSPLADLAKGIQARTFPDQATGSYPMVKDLSALDGSVRQAQEQAQAALTDVRQKLDRLGPQEQKLTHILVDELRNQRTLTLAQLPQELRDPIQKLLDVHDNFRQLLQGLPETERYDFDQEWFNRRYVQPKSLIPGRDPNNLSQAVQDSPIQVVGKGLKGPANFLKPRTLDTAREAFDGGLEPKYPNLADHVVEFATDVAKYIGGKKMVQNGRDTGRSVFVRTPQEANESGLTIPLGGNGQPLSDFVVRSPEVKATEYVDRKRQEAIDHFKQVNGIEAERTGGGPIGSYDTGTQSVQTKFATPQHIELHEIGHWLDQLHGFDSKLNATPLTDPQEWNNIARLRYEDNPQVSRNEINYHHRATERTANLMQAYFEIPERLQQVAPELTTRLEGLLGSVPALHDLMNVSRSLSLMKQESGVRAGGWITHGYYAVDPAEGQVLENRNSAGLRDNPTTAGAYRVTQEAANLLRLGNLFGVFHGWMSWRQLWNGIAADAIDKGGANLVPGVANVKGLADGTYEAIRNLTWPQQNVNDLRYAYLHPDDQNVSQEMQLKAKLMRDANFSANRDPEWENGFIRRMNDAARTITAGTVNGVAPTLGEKAGAALKALVNIVPASLEMWQRPILGHMVPNAKLSMFDRQIDTLRAQQPNMPYPQMVDEAIKIRNNIENTFGEVTRSNQLWNGAVRDIGYLMAISPQYKIGTYSQYGGGMVDASKYIANGLQKLLGNNTADPQWTRKMSYLIASATNSALLGGVVTYLMTGKPPQDHKDWLFPNTGELDARGNPIRLNFPSYDAEIYTALHGVADVTKYNDWTRLRDQYFNSANPLINAAYAWFANQDYSGRQVRQGGVTSGEELVDYAKKRIMPFQLQSDMRLQEEGASAASRWLNLAGIRPTGYNINASDLQRFLDQKTARSKSGVLSKNQIDTYKLKGQLTGTLRNDPTAGDKAVSAAVDAGKLTPEEANQLKLNSQMDPLELGIDNSDLTVADAVKAYTERATDEEKQRIYLPLKLKIQKATHLDEEERTNFLNQVKAPDKFQAPKGQAARMLPEKSAGLEAIDKANQEYKAKQAGGASLSRSGR